MSEINFLGDVTAEYTVAAKELNFRLNRIVTKEVEKQVGLALCAAADQSDTGTFRFLFAKYPGQINASNADRDTPFVLASNEGGREIVDLLLAQPKLAVNAQGNDGMTGFMHACDQNHTDIAKAIYEQRPDLDVTPKDRDGDTALIFAVGNKNVELTRLILQRPEANVAAKNFDGESAQSLAKGFKGKTPEEQEIQALIKAHPSYQATPPAPASVASAPAQPRRRGRPPKNAKPNPPGG